jgi:hypothetical protein
VAFAAWYVGGAIIVGILVSHFTAPPDLPEQLLGVFAVVHGLIILAAAIFIDDLCGGFLPEQILTFRDLSNCIATANTHLTKTDN